MASLSQIQPAFEALVARLRPIRSYYRGVGGDVREPLPGRVLCFSRLNRDSLGHSGARSSHHRYVVIIAIRGEGTVCIDAASYRLRPGSAVMIRPYQYHNYTDPDPALCWLFITFEAIPGSWEDLGDSVHTLGGMELQLAYEIAACWQEARRHHLLPWHVGLLLERMTLLPGRHHQEEPAPSLLVRVNEYALSRLDRIVSVGEIAQVLGISESHLRSEFRRTTGHALGGHLRHLRLQKACALLHTTEESIGRIAEACGFDSVYSFSRAFKAVHIVPPREYRRRDHF